MGGDGGSSMHLEQLPFKNILFICIKHSWRLPLLTSGQT